MTKWDEDALVNVATTHGTPCFVYSRDIIIERAKKLLESKMPYGFVPRYAVKANDHPEIVKLFHEAGLHFDASSGYEAEKLLGLGIPGESISLSSQQPAHNLPMLLSRGVQYVATSLHQLDIFLKTDGHPHSVGLRVNPGLGAGHNNRTTTGGVNSSFGLWHDYVPQALLIARANGVKITRLHIHIGSGADPSMWKKMIATALEVVEHLPDVVSLDVGGGYKIHRYGDEHETDMESVAVVFAAALVEFSKRTGRELCLEIEPGTWLVGHAGVLLAEVVDIVDTGENGHTFLRLNTGMNDFSRPGMYGAQHEIAVLNTSSEHTKYIVVGHNCETGDTLTPAPGDPEGIEPRLLYSASIGDIVAIYDTGAYCRTMSHKGYNSFPTATEFFL